MNSSDCEFLGQPPVPAAVVQNGIGSIRRRLGPPLDGSRVRSAPWVHGPPELVETRQLRQGTSVSDSVIRRLRSERNGNRYVRYARRHICSNSGSSQGTMSEP